MWRAVIILTVFLSCTFVDNPQNTDAPAAVEDTLKINVPKALTIRDSYWEIVSAELSPSGYRIDYNESNFNSYLQITGEKMVNWVRDTEYTGGFNYCSLIPGIPVGDGLLIAVTPDSIYLLQNDIVLRIRWIRQDCSSMAPGPNNCWVEGGWPTRQQYYYRLYDGDIPPSGWPALRTDSIVHDDLQGDWSLVKIESFRYGIRTWSNDSTVYKFTVAGDSCHVFRSDRLPALFSFTIITQDLECHFSSDLNRLDSLENIADIDTAATWSCDVQRESGRLSDDPDTLFYNKSSWRKTGYLSPPDTCYSNTYYFVRQ